MVDDLKAREDNGAAFTIAGLPAHVAAGGEIVGHPPPNALKFLIIIALERGEDASWVHRIRDSGGRDARAGVRRGADDKTLNLGSTPVDAAVERVQVRRERRVRYRELRAFSGDCVRNGDGLVRAYAEHIGAARVHRRYFPGRTAGIGEVRKDYRVEFLTLFLKWRRGNAPDGERDFIVRRYAVRVPRNSVFFSRLPRLATRRNDDGYRRWNA